MKSTSIPFYNIRYRSGRLLGIDPLRAQKNRSGKSPGGAIQCFDLHSDLYHCPQMDELFLISTKQTQNLNGLQNKRALNQVSTRFKALLNWSGKRDSNPRLSAWEADALPLNYSRTARYHSILVSKNQSLFFAGIALFLAAAFVMAGKW